MRSTKVGVVAFVAVALAAGTAPPAPAAGKAAKGGARVVGTDATDDWSASGTPVPSSVGADWGQDLEKASIGMKGGDLVFTIDATSPPPTGVSSVPTGYVWDFRVNGYIFQLMSCSIDLLTGCTDAPPVAGSMPFLLFSCDVTVFAGCRYLATYGSTIDAAAGTVSVAIPAKTLGAVPGSYVTGAELFGGSVAAFTGIIVQTQATDGASDEMSVTKEFVVPFR